MALPGDRHAEQHATNCNADASANGRATADSYTHADLHSNANKDAYSYANTHGHRDTDCHTNVDSGWRNGYTNAHRDENAYAYGHANRDQYASAHQHANCYPNSQLERRRDGELPVTYH